MIEVITLLHFTIVILFPCNCLFDSFSMKNMSERYATSFFRIISFPVVSLSFSISLKNSITVLYSKSNLVRQAPLDSQRTSVWSNSRSKSSSLSWHKRRKRRSFKDLALIMLMQDYEVQSVMQLTTVVFTREMVSVD